MSKTKSKKTTKDLERGQMLGLGRGLFARKTKTGVQYGISFTFNGTRRQEIVGDTKTAARQALAIRKAEIARGEYSLEKPETETRPTVAEFAKRYFEHVRDEKRSYKRDAGVLKTLVAFMGDKHLDQLAPFDFQRYKAERLQGKTVSKATINRELAICKTMLARAVDWGELEYNPAERVKLYTEPERDGRVLTPEEQALLVTACGPDLRPLVIVALRTGLRRGELFQLKWSHVDLRAGLLTVSGEESKSGKARTVPLDPVVQGMLETLPLPREKYVFPGRNGQRRTTVQKSWDRACRRAGIQTVAYSETGRAEIWPGLHDLRRTFATELAANRVDGFALQRIMGHASIKTTERYVLPTDETLRAAINSLRPATFLPHFVETEKEEKG